MGSLVTDFVSARADIEGVLKSNRSPERKRCIIQQILLSVSKGEDGNSMANGLIHLFDLNMVDRGSHMWFEGGPKYRPPIETHLLLQELEEHKYWLPMEINSMLNYY